MLSETHLVSLPEITSDEALPSISRWTIICGVSLISVFGLAFALAAIIRYPVKITANATVRPTGEIRVAQAPAEGLIKSINVKENQLIHQGDVIAILDDSQLQMKKSQLVGNIQNYQTQLKRVDAQITALATQRIAEEHLMNTEVAEAEADLNLAQTSYQRYQQLANQGAVSQQQWDEKKQSYQVALAKIAQQQARGQSALAVMDKERGSLLERRDELQNQLNRDSIDLKQSEADLQKYVIRAPEAGTLLKLDLRNVGQVVRSAETIAQIAPGSAPLIVKAQVDTQDIGKVALNQKVHLRVNAYPYPDYGILTGRVVAIAPDALQPLSSNSVESNSKTQTNTTYYEVTIRPEKLYLKGDSKNALQPGMQLTAEIISKEETVLRFLLRQARLITDT